MKKRVLCFLTTFLVLIGCSNPAPRADFAGLVDIGGGRKLYLECRGNGSPTVVLVSGTGSAFDDWSYIIDATGAAKPSQSAVLPEVSKFTRVCAYDRPGTERVNGTLTSSTSVSQPTTAQDGVADLDSLLTTAKEPGPYVLVGHSWGGLIAKLYASTHPNKVDGLVLIDSASEFLKVTLTPAQWELWMQKIKASLSPQNADTPDYELSVEQVRAAAPVGAIPAVVLTADKPWDLSLGDTGSTWPAWLSAQDRLATLLKAKHITHTNSGHEMPLSQPGLVIDAIRGIVDTVRSSKPK